MTGMKGSVDYLFAFDVANEIRTRQAGLLLGQKPFPFAIRTGAAAPKDLPVAAPMTVTPSPMSIAVGGVPVQASVVLKVFDVGVISLSFSVPYEVAAPGDLLPYHAPKAGSAPLAAAALELALQACTDLRSCMVKPTEAPRNVEAYTVFCITDPGAPADAWVRSRRGELGALLNEEADPARLAEAQLAETFRHGLSYTTDDHAVVDWDSALVVDRGGYVEDVLYMIELANLQVEEYRILDDRLDRFFLQAYEDLERYAPFWSLLFPPDRTLRRIRQMRMDITRMSEELSNITKFVGDWYLARVYLACKDRFHLAQWEASVDQKLVELDRIYSLVHHDVNEKRMLVLEIAIVALFLVDLAALLFKKS
jgi:hypothetical protein